MNAISLPYQCSRSTVRFFSLDTCALRLGIVKDCKDKKKGDENTVEYVALCSGCSGPLKDGETIAITPRKPVIKAKEKHIKDARVRLSLPPSVVLRPPKLKLKAKDTFVKPPPKPKKVRVSAVPRVKRASLQDQFNLLASEESWTGTCGCTAPKSEFGKRPYQCRACKRLESTVYRKAHGQKPRAKGLHGLAQMALDEVRYIEFPRWRTIEQALASVRSESWHDTKLSGREFETEVVVRVRRTI